MSGSCLPSSRSALPPYLGSVFPSSSRVASRRQASLRKTSAASEVKRASFIRFDGGMARGGGSSSMWFWDPVCYLHRHLEPVDTIFPWQGIRPGGVGGSAYSRRCAFFSKLSLSRGSQRPVSRRKGVSRGSIPFPRLHSLHIYTVSYWGAGRPPPLRKGGGGFAYPGYRRYAGEFQPSKKDIFFTRARRRSVALKQSSTSARRVDDL